MLEVILWAAGLGFGLRLGWAVAGTLLAMLGALLLDLFRKATGQPNEWDRFWREPPAEPKP